MPYPHQEGGTWLLRCEAVGQNLPYGLGSLPPGPRPGPGPGPGSDYTRGEQGTQ